MATCLLVRHGHSDGNAAGVLSGRTPGVLLTDRGRDEVESLAMALSGAPLVRLVSSPLERCVATAEAIAADRDGLTVETDERLVECGYGAWTGLPLTELVEDPLWRVVQDRPEDARFPASDTYVAESVAEMAARAVAAVRGLDAEVEATYGPRAAWVAVSHGDLLKAVVGEAAGSPLRTFQRIVVEPASVAVVRFTPERPFLLGLNTDAGRVAALIAAHASAGHDATPGGSTGEGS